MLSEVERRRIAAAIRDQLARAHVSRQSLAFKTKLGKSTVDKLLVGLFSLRTLSIVEEALSVRFRHFDVAEERADEGLGGYLRSDLLIYEGDYLFIRPSFKAQRTIFAFPMSIAWASEPAGLTLRQFGEAGPLQSGTIFVPRVSFHVFIYSRDASCTRHLILSRMDPTLRLRGLMLTLANRFANAYAPVSAPVVLFKRDAIDDEATGRIEADHPLYESYKAELISAERDGPAYQISASDL